MEKKPKDQPGVKRTKLENAIAVVGFKAALLVGYLSHGEDDCDSDTGIESKFSSSTDLRLSVLLSEKIRDEKQDDIMDA